MITTLGSVDPYLSPVELEGHVIPLRGSAGHLISRLSKTYLALSLGHGLPKVFVNRIIVRV